MTRMFNFCKHMIEIFKSELNIAGINENFLLRQKQVKSV